MSWNNYGRYHEYVSVSERKEKIAHQVAKFKKKNGIVLQPIVVEGRVMAKTFWGKAWFKNLESYQDYAYRLERGRSYVRHGAVIDLKINSGEVHALVCGTHTYKVKITIAAASQEAWRSLIDECSGKINSLIELLQGKFSQNIMQVITQSDKGLFPKSEEITFDCSCFDHALMCKHVSAVLYGVGIRLDDTPDQLFLLRKVDQNELLLSAVQDVPLGVKAVVGAKKIDDDLSQLFGIEIEEVVNKQSTKKQSTKKQPREIKQPEKIKKIKDSLRKTKK
jgi:Uncharacterized conserved protein